MAKSQNKKATKIPKEISAPKEGHVIMIFGEDKFYNNEHIAYANKPVEIPKNMEVRWLKRGGVTLHNGERVLTENLKLIQIDPVKEETVESGTEVIPAGTGGSSEEGTDENKEVPNTENETKE